MTSTQRIRPLPLSALRRQSSVATTACDRRALFATLWLALTFLLASCGGRAVSTDTGNPTVNETRIRVTATDTGVLVTGDPGAVSPGGATVLVTNDTTDDSVTTTAETDGSFEAEIAGTVDDDIAVDVAAGPPELTGVKWTIRNVTNGDTGAGTGDSQFGSITFNVDGTLELTSECNSGGGSYFASSEGNLTLSDITLSQMACPDSATVTEDILSVMREGNVTFNVVGDELTLTRGASSIFAVASPLDSDLEGRQFVLESVEGYTLVQDTTISLLFQDGEIAFGAGCNSYSGPYTLCGDSFCTEGFGSTEIGCDTERHAQDEAFAEFLGSMPAFEFDGERLTLRGTIAGENVIFVFLDRELANPDQPLAGRAWTVDTLIQGEVATGGADISIRIEFSDDGTVDVFSACNTGRGEYSVSGNVITLSGIAYTEEGCQEPAAGYERQVQSVMTEGEVTFTIDADRLTIMRGDIGLSATTP